MNAQTPLRCTIRDGGDADIARCVAVNHTYETDHVLQIHVRQDEHSGWDIALKRERLPRMLGITLTADADRLRHARKQGDCFLVAESPGGDHLLGYLAMRNDQLHRIGLIHDLVVSEPYRRGQIGLRLVAAARVWARENHLSRLTIELQTKNAPAIAFCQALGFIFSGYNDRYFPNQDIAVFFSLSLR